MGNKQITYSVPISEKKEGESAIYRHPQCVDGLMENFQGVDTLQELMIRNSQKYANYNLLGVQVTTGQKSKHYVYKTYSECFELARFIGSGIINLNLIPQVREYQGLKLKLIGIFAKNREEWYLLDYANMLYGNTMIPLYDTLGPESIPYVLNQSEISTIVCSAQSVEALLKVADVGQLQTIVTLDNLSEETIKKVEALKLKIIKWEDILSSGQANPQQWEKVNPNDVFTFSYTSGTTGNPKGAMITHKNLCVTSGSIIQRNVSITTNDVHLSYLPLPHVLERVVSVAFFGHGATICIYGGDVMKIKDDMVLAKPTIFVSVPRLYLRLFQAIKDKLEGMTGIKKRLVDRGFAAKMYYLKNGGYVTHKLWDKLVFNKTKEAFGGRVRFMLTGSAPISAEIIDFIKIVACCPVIEGYGQTESTGGSFLTDPSDPFSGHVGGPLPNNEFKVIDVPEMNYFSTDKDEQGHLVPRGEICFRGNNIFLGYYKDNEKTSEALDADGWLHSGDIGMILPNGSLKLFDRRKNIFKLSQGEYIAPEKVENIYLKVKGVAEVFVYGDSLQSFCVAIIVPSHHELEKIATSLNIQGTPEELCKSPEINKYFLDQLTKQGKADQLNGMERVQKIYLEPVSFVEHNCMTNTMKLQRHNAKVTFKKVIDQLYGL